MLTQYLSPLRLVLTAMLLTCLPLAHHSKASTAFPQSECILQTNTPAFLQAETVTILQASAPTAGATTLSAILQAESVTILQASAPAFLQAETVAILQASAPTAGVTTLSTPKRGDVNGDGRRNVSDIMLIVNYILGQANEDFNTVLADLNNDGNVNVSDIMILVNIILGMPYDDPDNPSLPTDDPQGGDPGGGV